MAPTTATIADTPAMMLEVAPYPASPVIPRAWQTGRAKAIDLAP